MYRCTECNKEFDICPSFCDCGNDTFEEFDYYEPEPVKPAPAPKRRLTPEEMAELEEETKDKKKALITIAVCVFLSILILFLPPYRAKKSEKIKENKAQINKTLPQLEAYWDNTLPSAFRKTKDPTANLPLLNSNLGAISSQLRAYLVEVGGEFNRKWNSAVVKGTGECKVEFTINKEGSIVTKKIVSSSHNESLDDSVLMALSAVTSLNIPPEDYKGERIYIAFKIMEDQGSKVYYPTK